MYIFKKKKKYINYTLFKDNINKIFNKFIF